MLRRVDYASGRILALLVSGCAGVLAIQIMSSVSPLVALAVVVGGIMLAAVVHELGHLLACLLAKVEVWEFHLGAPPLAFRFRVGTTRVILGLPFRGHVKHGPATTARQAAVLAAGPLADVAAAGVVLTLPMARESATCLAVLFGAIGIASLVPWRTKKGGMSDGARLLDLRGYGRNAAVQADMREFAAAPDGPGRSERAGRVLAAYREGVPIAREWAGLLAEMLRREGRMAEVLEPRRAARAGRRAGRDAGLVGAPGRVERRGRAGTAR